VGTPYAEGMNAGGEAEEDVPSAALPLSRGLIRTELEAVRSTLGHHIQRLAGGLPSATPERSAEQLNAMLTELVGELMYSAAKLEALARTLNGEVR
jgi:hypothetical protein